MRPLKITLTGLLVLIVFALSTSLFAQDGGLLAQVTTAAWLRSGPGTEWRRLEVLQAGRALRLDGHSPDGLWARGITSGGTVGWMGIRFLNVSSDQVLALPEIWVDTPFTLPAPPASADSTTAPAAATPVPSVSDNTSSPGGGLLVSASTRVNMRSGPGTTFSRLATITSGTPLLVDGRDSSGRWVRGIVPNGTVGWVSTGGVSISASQLAGLPIINPASPFVLPPPGSNAVAAPNNPPAATVPNNPVASTAPVTGFAYGGHIRNFNTTTFNAMWRAGMTWIKVQVRYYAGQDPSGLSGMINAAHSGGFRILLGIVGVTSELNNGGYYDQYAAYVAGAAALGADAIEVWNEPNIDREWPGGQIDPAAYTNLLRTAYNAIKAANPNTLVVSGAPAPTGFFGGCSGGGCDDNQFVAGMAAAGAASYLDCVGVHYNEGILPPSQTSGDPRGSSSHYSRYFWGMVNTYTSAFGSSRPLCFTELGYLSPEGYGTLPGGFAWAQNVTVAQQAAWLDSAVALARSSGRVRLVIIWNIDYTGVFGDDPMGGYAIIRPDGGCPACDALGS
ncbi:MAG: SH3 domain-containing protein [Chloroflexi bacterium]|nr:SH3 domain-containing protein [Chloroflexota bacterium]